MRRAILVPISFVLILSGIHLAAQSTYTADQSKSHIGERATVCGVVASARYAASSKGQPTFVNLDKPYPNQIFTVLIWGSDRAKFGAPEKDFAKKNICVTGMIEQFRGAAEIIAKSPSLQIAVKIASGRGLSRPGINSIYRAEVAVTDNFAAIVLRTQSAGVHVLGNNGRRKCDFNDGISFLSA